MRYIGCKSNLLQEIEKLLTDKKLCNSNYTFFDAFSGTGCVGAYLKNKYKIIANDIQYYSFIMTQAKLNSPDLKFSKLGFDPFDFFNKAQDTVKGFIYTHYSLGGSTRKYFSEENAGKIDFFRETIDYWYNTGKITEKEYYYLLGSLLESISKVSNVAGVYGSFLKKWDPRALKKINFIHIEEDYTKTQLYENEVYNQPIEKLINDISGDIIYLDPPYTHNQYSVQYHLLETIAKNDKPAICGKGGLRNTHETASNFSKKGYAEVAFEYIIAKSQFKHIILSYSSDGLMSEKFIENVLKRYGKPDTYEKRKISYKRYQNHKTTPRNDHQEFLFYIEKKRNTDVQFASPLNYQGGKYDLIDFIKSHLPKDPIKKFIDLFGGGYNVGININAEQIIYNDYNHKVKELIEMFRTMETSHLIRYILQMIKKYKLSPNAKEPYLKLRDIYNKTELNKRESRLLYLLVLYGFNQQIRFNNKYDYNNPVGPAGFNEKMLEKLTSFCRRIKEQNIILLSDDFENLNEYIDKNSFIYCDPPYLITLGSYNDGRRGFNGWSDSDEIRLYNFLDSLNKQSIKFMLSNVIEHRGKINTILTNWVTKNNYNIYKNDKISRGDRNEVIITNY